MKTRIHPMLDRLSTVIVAISLAVLLWLFARTRQFEPTKRAFADMTGQTTDSQNENEAMEVEAPVHFLCPPSFPYQLRMISNDSNATISIRMQGPRREVSPKVKAYVDLTRKVYDKGKHAEVAHVEVPPGFHVDPEDIPAVVFELVPIEQEQKR